MEKDQVFTVSASVEYMQSQGLKTSKWLVGELIRRKELPHIRIGKGRGKVFIRKSTLDAWLENLEKQSVAN